MSGETLPASSFTCFNTEGIDVTGTVFKKDCTVGKGKVQALCIGMMVPEQTGPGKYEGVVSVSAENYGRQDVKVSQGRKAKEGYRIRWDDVVYEPGTVRVVAYRNGEPWAETEMKTAGKAAKTALEVDYAGNDLTYVTARILDKEGNFVPTARNLLKIRAEGPATLVAADAGDPTCHTPFHSPEINAFNGLCSAIVRRTGPGPVTVSVASDGLKPATITLP